MINLKRVIFIEPEIENKEDINNIFNKYNPDSSFVNPHICLVFPFESELSTETIDSLIKGVFTKYEEFNITLRGLDISYEENNNFLFLNVIDDLDILKKISKELYDCLEEAKLKKEYIPHITIGKSKSIEEIKDMYMDANNLLTKGYSATISNIYCKKLIKDENNTRLEDELVYQLTNKKNKSL